MVSNTGGGSDAVVFGSSVAHDAVAFFRQDFDLIISYANSSDQITIKNEFAAGNDDIGMFKLNDGSYLSQADVNSVIQNMSSYAADNGIAFANVNDVKNSADLMNVIASSWKPQ